MVRSLKLLIALCGLAFLAAMPAAPTCAQEIEDRACDPEFVDAVESKGWLEAQRETAQNQNLLYKLDSVLEYTCFQQFMETVAVRQGPRFSETQKWRHPAGFSDISTDIALQRVVGFTLVAYLQSNFPHTYMGGRLPVSTDPPPNRPAGQYLCDAMEYVWREIKCTNFLDKSAFTNDTPDIDGFYEFTRYAQQDTRRLPPQFASCAPAATNINLTSRSAYNQRQTQFIMPQENPNDEEPYIDDPLVSRLEYILPAPGCGEGATPAPVAIDTGVMVRRNEGGLTRNAIADYSEHVCANPGCSYDGERCVGVP